MKTLLTLMGTTGSNASGGGSMVTTFITIGLMILVFYFLLIRPQKKKEKEAKAMLAAMKKGDKIVTIGGLHGKITKVNELTVVIQVKDGSELEFNKSAVSTVLNKTAAEPKKTKKDKKAETSKINEVEAEEVEVEEVEAEVVEAAPNTTENKN